MPFDEDGAEVVLGIACGGLEDGRFVFVDVPCSVLVGQHLLTTFGQGRG